MATVDEEAKRNIFSFNNKADFKFMNAGNNGERKRAFMGVGYSGEVISDHFYWGNLVLDLDTMEKPINKPALLDHDIAKRCGYITEASISYEKGLEIQGPLLSNEFGTQIHNDSDEGFPWQMSVRINPGIVEEVAIGNSVFVNGREFDGPVTVFRNSTIDEVSFTALGWDDKTSATALNKFNQSKEHNMTMTAEEQKDLADAKLAVTTATNDKLTAEQNFSKEQAAHEATKIELQALKDEKAAQAKEFRKKEIEAFAKANNLTIGEDSDQYKTLFSLDSAAFKTTTDMITSSKAGSNNDAPANIFGHQATGGEGNNTDKANMGKSALVADAKSRAENK